MRLAAFIALLIVGAAAAAAPAPDPRVQVPEGFTVEKVAGDPAVVFPMFACFDDRGRLFVAESSGLDLYAELQKLTRKCRISMLQDMDGDGRFETASVFADGLVYPMGLTWRDGKLYVADPPDLITLQDTDGDGRADKRATILSGFGHEDNGSLHGLTFGPDGLLYMTTGHPDGYQLKRADGSMLTGQSGALLRCGADGSNPQVLARGFENLVEIAFLPGGEMIGTNNWYQKPSGGVRDALVHLVDGGLYPLYLRDVGTPQVVSGEPLPPLTTFPAVALSGLLCYEGASFPAQFRGDLFAAQHNARKVTRHVLARSAGATFRSADSDFVSSADPDFHPSDVLEDADGSLLVVDTGGWYVQHCPTGKIRGSHAPGGIYRVRFGAAKPITDPWGLHVAWETLSPPELGQLLRDSRPAVRRKAGRALVRAADAAVESLRLLLTDRDANMQSDAAWTLSAIGSDAALEPMRQLVRQDPNHPAVVRALASRSDQKIAPALERGVTRCEDPAARLALFEALARCGAPTSVPSILAALEREQDRFVEHALLVALHRLADQHQLAAALETGNPRVQRAALLLLDQPPHRCVTASQVLKRISAGDVSLRKTALAILSQHSEWVSDALPHFKTAMKASAASEKDRQDLADGILAFSAKQELVDWLGDALADRSEGNDDSCRTWIIQMMARVGRPKSPARWIEPLRAAIGDPRLRDNAAHAAAALQMPELDEQLLPLARDASVPPQLRMDALRAVIERHSDIDQSSLEFLVNQFGAQAAPPLRLAATEVLAKALLTDEQFARLLTALRNDSLASPDTLYPLLLRGANPQTAQALADYLTAVIKKGWRPDEQKLTQLLAPLRPLHEALAQDLLAQVRSDKDRQREQLASLEPLLSGGDEARGRAVFLSAKVGCATCHRVGDAGGRVGPDLTKVGAIRSGHDILESVVFPSSTLAQGYENYVVKLKGGQVLSGILAEQSTEGVVLRDSSGAERRLRAEQIEKMRRDPTSVMPQGLDQALTPQEFRDLLAFLQSLK